MKIKKECWYDVALRECGGDAAKIGRYLAVNRFPGIDEKEAIAYARGIAKGLALAGRTGDEAKILMACVATEDKLLDAGNTYMGVNIVESMMNEKQ